MPAKTTRGSAPFCSGMTSALTSHPPKRIGETNTVGGQHARQRTKHEHLRPSRMRERQRARRGRHREKLREKHRRRYLPLAGTNPALGLRLGGHDAALWLCRHHRRAPRASDWRSGRGLFPPRSGCRPPHAVPVTGQKAATARGERSHSVSTRLTKNMRNPLVPRRAILCPSGRQGHKVHRSPTANSRMQDPAH